MKLVINKCYGGFSLSPKAVEWIAHKQGKKCYFFDSKGNPITKGYPEGSFWNAFSTNKPTDKNYNKYVLDKRPEDRADPLLVQAVEELGNEASGDCAELKIVEIPDDVKWEIQEYDGFETIHEVHRVWGD